MSEILITGGAGFIGSQLAYKLYKQGNNVIIVDNFSYGHEDNLQFEDVDLNDKVYKLDIRDSEAIDELFINHHFLNYILVT